MSLRKFISLLLLVAFSFQTMPVFATATLDNASSTLSTVAAHAGTKANGANRDVVPVTVRVNFSAGDVAFGGITGLGGVADHSEEILMEANGRLAVNGDNGTLSASKVFVLSPPTGTRFVALDADGYTTPRAGIQVNGGTLTTDNVTLSGGFDNADLPGGSEGSANGNVIIAGVNTINGGSTFFGTTLPHGSLIAYFVTSNTVGDTNATGGSITFDNVGLAADPSGDSSLATSGNLSATYFDPGTSTKEALSSLSGSSTVEIVTAGSAAGKVEFLMLGDKTGTETSTTEEPDSQPNSALASLLSTAGVTVDIGPDLITSTGSSLTTLNVDTDTLLLRAAESDESTSSARTYHQTPFATSALVLSSDINGDSASTLNTSLDNTTMFPNTANAKMTVTFTVVDASTGAALTDGTTITVDAATVSLFNQRSFDGIRNTTGGGEAEALTGINGGFLGAAISGINGDTLADYAVGVLYNGLSATGALKVNDVSKFDYTPSATDVGFPQSLDSAVPAATTASTTLAGSTLVNGNLIAPGSLITANDATGGEVASTAIVLNNFNGRSLAVTFSGSTGSVGIDATADAHDPFAASVRLKNVASNAFFAIVGNQNGDAMTTTNALKLGSTNISTNPNYQVGPNTARGPADNTGAANNAIAAARLNGTSLCVLPLQNRYDTFRDAIAIRPEITLSLGTTAKANGVKVIATATGGNLSGSTEVIVAQVLAAGSLDIDASLEARPVGGNLTGLMLENGTDAGNGRSLIELSSLTGASTSTDELTDLNGTLAIDDTLPPFFCGGAIGDGSKGPNGAIFQPNARAILITENGTDAFEVVSTSTNTVLRVLLPEGVDLNAYSATASTILGILATGTASASEPFSTLPTITRVQNIHGTITQAFIDIDVGVLGTPTNAVKRIIELVFKPNALVAPTTVSDFTATVQVVYTGTSNTYGADITDDVVLDTIGTVSIADGCSTFLTLNYCDDALSSYTARAVSTDIQQDFIDNGSNLVSFTAPSSTRRLIQSSPADVTLPDLCIAEGTPGSLPIGPTADGVPTIFGEASTTAAGTARIHIASSFEGATGVGLDSTATLTVRTSDNSVAIASETTSTNEAFFTVSNNSGTNSPFEETTEFRLSGLKMDAASGATDIPPAQSFFAWVEAVTGAGDYVIGTTLPLSSVEDSVNGDTLVNMTTAASEEVHFAAFFSNGRTQDGSIATTDVDFTDTSATNNDLDTVINNTNTPILADAVTTLIDDSNYDKLSEDTVLSVSTATINGSTHVLATVSAGPGSLEPGSLITVSTSGTGPSDSVTVPVAADGSFKAIVRAVTTQSLTVVQAPTTGLTTVSPQVVQLDVADQNVDPEIISAVASDIYGVSSITKKGKLAVVFTVVSKGKLDGVDYTPTADQLTLSGNPVTAVTGTTDKFIGVVDFANSGELTVTSTADGTTSSVTMSGLSLSNPSRGGKPNLRKMKVNKKGFLVVRGQRLRNNEDFGFVLDDGTFQAVNLRSRTSSDKKRNRRRSESAATIPTNAVYAIFHIPGRGVDSEAL